VGAADRVAESCVEMTARRGLKKIVRERMTRTGETYSTALRTVARPIYRHRASTVVGYLLERAGLSLPEPTVCGLGGGIGFMYAVFEYKALPHPLLTIVAQHHPQPWYEAVFDRIGARYEVGHGGRPRAVLEAADGPLLCTVDRRGLPWRTDTPDYGAADPHTVVFEGGTVLDPPYGEQAMDLDAFVAAWAAHQRGRFHRVSLTEVSDVDLAAAARSAVDVTVAHLTGPVLGNSFDVNFGFSGMAKLAAELRDGRTRKGWAKRFAAPESQAYARKRMVECLEQEYTAPGATRPIYAEFLEPYWPDAAALFRRSAQCWSSLAVPAIDDFRTWCDRAADLVDEARSLEEQAVSGPLVRR
jgi:hypothetical protein